MELCVEALLQFPLILVTSHIGYIVDVHIILLCPDYGRALPGVNV